MFLRTQTAILAKANPHLNGKKKKKYGSDTWRSSTKSKELWIRQQNGDFPYDFDHPLWPMLLHSLPHCWVYSFPGTKLVDPFHESMVVELSWAMFILFSTYNLIFNALRNLEDLVSMYVRTCVNVYVIVLVSLSLFFVDIYDRYL